MKSNSFVSIIIPTYHDWSRLALCIKALDNQTYPKEFFEVIIVNNDPNDQVPANYYLPRNMSILSEGKAGSYAARNAGLEVAKGEIIGFTDADCVPHSDWITNAVERFSTGNVDRLGGKIELFYQNASKKTWIELYESIYSFNQKKTVEVLKGSVTANFFARRELFDKVGKFDASKKSGDDIGWNRRANTHGFNLFYADNVKIGHPARATFKEFTNQRRREFGGKKEFNLNFKSIIKNILYIPYLFYVLVINKTWSLLLNEKNVPLVDKAKVTTVNIYLYFILVFEFFKLMFGGARVR
ncbi:glycosyltransferase [Pontibacter pamirensis]|uniref:glycosyltransferase n=1 Tax=Pontibacter pamirensis TaxID=2562824 RepID=UPI00138953C5|nr:glycosyltransferase [Pontibacter pamirensis]